MPWVKLDDGFDEHPAIEGLTDGAFRLLVCSLTYCGRNLSDGFIPAAKALRLTATARQKCIDELVAQGRWEAAPDGYWVKSFLEFNPSRAKVLDERFQAAERQRKHRESQRDSKEGHGVTSPEVNRSRPDPTRSEKFSESSATAVDKSENERAGVMEAKAVISDAKSSLTRIHPRRAS